jgi:SAM-dependent methyltransferase
VWLPQFICPECRRPVVADGDGGFCCGPCGEGYPCTDGIFRFLTRRRAAAAEPFVRQYRAVRARDGHREHLPEFYRTLPMVRREHRCAAEWRIRRESYGHLQARALPAVWQGPIHVLDVGAGCGWLAHRLASFGHCVVAVDQLDDGEDGLGVCQHYPVTLAAVQADFDALPLEAAQFEVVVLNSSLHYSSDPAATLREARRTMIAGGALVVMDSPMFTRERDGRAMVDQQCEALLADSGGDDGAAMRRGIGFLTYDSLDEVAAALGLRARFFPSRGPLAWRLRRQLARLRLKRAPAAFGLWVAQ